jgi:hypothetical protein
MTTPSQIQKDLIEWRRAKVIELVSKVLEKYLVETVPLEMAKCLSRLTAISDEVWSMIERAKGDKEKAAALALAQRTTVLILNVVTNNKVVVDDALKFGDSIESKGRQKEARNKINELSRKTYRLCVELAPMIIIIITLYLLSAFLVSGSARAKPTWTQS